jgi:hypothetical protein
MTAHIGLDNKDLLHAKRLSAESFEVRAPLVRIQFLDHSDPGTVIDTLYGEMTKAAEKEKLMRAHIFTQPPKQLLKKYGIDIECEAILVCSRKICDDLDYTPQIGDRVQFAEDSLGRQWRVDTHKPMDFFLNTQFNLLWVCTMRQAEDRFDATAGNPEH